MARLTRILREINLKEHPDTIKSRDFKGLNYRDFDTITFGYLDDLMYVAITDLMDDVATHKTIPDFYRKCIAPYEDNHYPDRNKLEKILNVTDIYRSDFKYAGRVWAESHLISFWQYPQTQRELMEVIDDIKKELNNIRETNDIPFCMYNLDIRYIEYPSDFEERALHDWEDWDISSKAIGIRNYDKVL